MPGTVHLNSTVLTHFTTSLFERGGVNVDEASVIADSLVDANLCGHDSHGVVRVSEYLGLLAERKVRPGVPLTIVSEAPAVLVCDANFGFGQVQMRRLIDLLAPRSQSLGIACGTMRNCGHVGRLGEWLERLGRLGLAGLMTVNDNGVLKCVAPPGGVEACISTNPVSIGAPLDGEPLVVDVSTSVVANGKIRVAQLAGEQVPDGWLIDAEGRPTNDPATRFADPPGSILPMGGYKGFGLGLLLDALVGGLSGGLCPPAPADAIECNNVLLVVFDPARFAGADAFKTETQKLTDFARNCRTSPGGSAIRLPGDRSRACRSQRLVDGIPLNLGTWSGLIDAAQSLNVSLPELIEHGD